MKTRSFSRSIRRWFGDNRREHLSELRQPKKSRQKAKPHLRPTFEVLEDRTLLSVLPPPIVLGQTDIAGLALGPGTVGNGGNQSSPAVAVDPLNPQKMVVAFNYTPKDPPPDGDGDAPDQTTFVEAAFSVDGGTSWTLFFDPVSNLGTFGNFNDAGETPSMTDPDQTLELADSASLAIDRSGSLYLTYVEHNPDFSSGYIIMQKFDFSSSTPATLVINKVLYAWSGPGPAASDAAMNPTIVVDNNPQSFTDPVTNLTQVDPFSGNIYVSWSTRLAPPNGGNPPPPPTFNPNTIQVIGSFDGGATFSTQIPLDGNGFAPQDGLRRDTTPQLVVGQSSAASASSAVSASPAPTTVSFAGGAGLSSTDNFYAGFTVNFISGADQTSPPITRTVVSYVGSTHVFTFSAPWPVAPASGDRFVVSRLAGGQLTGIWDDFGTSDLNNPGTPKSDNIVSNSLLGGGGVIVHGTTTPPVADAGPGTPNVAATSLYTATVAINDARVPNITDLDVSVTLTDQNLSDLHLKLVSPTVDTSSVQAGPVQTASTVQAMPAPTGAAFAGGASLSSINGFYNGFLFTFTSGMNAGQSRTVTTYNGATKVFTFATAWTNAPMPGDAFNMPGPTTTSFEGGASLSSVDGFYDGLALTFTSGPNQGQSRTVLTYTGSTKVFTFSSFDAWSEAPRLNDSFILAMASITLVDNKTNADGTTNMGIGINGMSLGVGNGVSLGTVFDDEAERFITDRGAMAPYIGHFRPEGSFADTGSLSTFAGVPTFEVNGTWTLLVTDTRNEMMPMVPFNLQDWFLNFSMGMTLGRESTIAGSHVLGRNVLPFPPLEGSLTPAVSPDIGIGPGLVIAQDNTLGSFSPYQGRIYASFVAHDIFTGNPKDNTYIVLYHSDDGGLTWSGPTQVNDDSIFDNFSEGTRPVFEPSIAVDQTTGTLVMSFLDTRNDPARARYATYLATSIDGGNTFAPETPVNQMQTATDVITGNTVNVEPIPDNVSTNNANRDTTFGMGPHQALAVSGGHVYAFWAGNFNGNNLLYGKTSVERSKTNILMAQVEIAAGPRIVSGTMGPVQSTTVDGFTFNNTVTTDGLPLVTGFAVSFDRPIDPTSFTASDISVFYRDTVTAPSQPSTVVASPAPTTTSFAGGASLSSSDNAYNGFSLTFTSGANAGFSRIVATYTGATKLFTFTTPWPTAPAVGDAFTVQTPGTFVAVNNPVPLGTPGSVQNLPTPSMSSFAGDPGLAGKDGFYNGFTLTFTSGPNNGQTRTVTAYVGPQNLFTFSSPWFVAPNVGDTFTLQSANSSTDFFVPFQTPQTGRGTYSYAVGPTIMDTIRTLQATLTPGLPQTFNSTINNQPIPDVGAISNTITVSGFAANQIITNVRVTVNITHTQDADLTLILIAPDGTPITLAAQEGSGNDPANQNFTNTTFADGFPSINTGTAPYMGIFSPLEPLRDFIGKSPNGTWTLEVSDAFVLDAGTLNSWSLRITPGTKGGLMTINGNSMDQNGNAVTGEGASPTSSGDIFAIPTPINHPPFQLPYSQDTLPMIVPGPHIVNTFVPNQPVTSDNLVLNGTNNAIDVVFDRDMDPSTFTTANASLEILRMIGPAGQITGPFTITPNPNGTDPDPNHPRTFKIGFPAQQLSGTYTITLAPVIRAKAQPGQTVGDLMDTNLNAGVDVLRGIAVNPAAATFAPVSHSYAGPPVTIAPGKSISVPLNFGPENFVITSGNAALLQSTSVQLNISYPNDPDLELFLMAPDGTSVRLFQNFGASLPPPHANFTNTVFNDNAATPIQNGVPPYNSSATGPFNPQTPLSVLNGKGAAGVYQLIIKDDASSVTGAHTLNSWSLTLWEAVPGTGLGEPVADQAMVHFRIFTMDTQNPLAHNVWTAVGPASINGNGNSGRIGGIAVDPSDPSGNTVYVAGASGGVWKTTNFLTTDPNGPTYIPLTDFGPTFAINIGSIAVFGRNNDPNQSIIFASTGEGDTGSSGVGVIRSMDGGATWTLLDSTVNVDASNNPLPINSPMRDHIFVGTTSFKIIVDPTHAITGPNDAIVYMALGGSATSGGLWRSVDSGKHWTRMTTTGATSPSQIATDVVLAPDSALPGSGNLGLVYAAFQGAGVYKSGSQGTNLTLMAGGAGNGSYRDFDFSPPTSIPVNNDAVSPNGANGRIVLATVGLTGNPVQDQLYEGWLYAAVATTGGHLQGLYLTKDGGGNWTKIRLPIKIPDPAKPIGFPTNDESQPDHDPLGANVGGGLTVAQGNYDISLAVDPTNPNISYLGGTADFNFRRTPFEPGMGLIRVDATNLFDPHNTVPFDNHEPDGGALMRATNGAITVKTDTSGVKFDGYGLITTLTPYLNLLTDPLNPFVSNSTLLFTHVASFSNEGAEATWTTFEDAVNGTTDQHRVVAIKDPLTGHARLIFGDDQGIFSAVDRGDGTFDTGIGTAATPLGSRNGNLQITQFYYGAAQPSILAAQIGAALFYGNAQDDGFPTSDPNILNNGNIGWGGPTGDGSGIATDQTGSGTAYSYQWPCCGINFPTTDFFLVAPNGPGYISRTGTASGFSLIQQNNPGPIPDPQWPFLGAPAGRGEVQSNFAVNPINGNAIVIGSAAGRLFRTETQGNSWFVIGDPTTNNLFDGSTIPALAFGAPDPANTSATFQDDFIYAGTTSGRLLMTPDGGGHWFNISSDGTHSLDGSSVMSISANPTRGSHEIYLVTTNGVYHVTFNVAYPTNAAPTISNLKLTNITANLLNIQTTFSSTTNPNPNNGLLFQLNTTTGALAPEQLRASYLTSIVADWRFQVPPSSTTGVFHPILYVGGEAGVFRSMNQDAATPTWTIFPSVADGSPVDGGYLPLAHVTDLDLAVGNVNPTNGKPDQSFGFNMLVATTYGRGTFAIRLPNNSPFNQFSGPQVQSLVPDPAHHGDPPGTLSAVKVTFKGAVDPATFTQADIDSFLNPNGASIAITTIDNLTQAPTPGQPPPPSVFDLNFAPQTTGGVYTITLGPNIADFAGNLMDQDGDTGTNGEVNGQPDDIYSGRFFLTGVATVPAILGHDPSSGQVRVAISNGNNAFNDSIFGTLNPFATWVDVITGDFNGDGKTDIAARLLQTGQWYVGINTGNAFAFTLWATWNPGLTWVDVRAGDFNGDGKDDIVGRVLQSSQWWVATSLGNSFNTILWASWNPAFTWTDTQVGDFNGATNIVNGKPVRIMGITSRTRETGQWFTAISTGNSFSTSLWDQWNPGITWVDVKVGDFNGDGQDDIIGRNLNTGDWWASMATGTPATSFTKTLWTTWNPGLTWVDVQVGDFNGDGKADLTGRVLQSGRWYTAISNGNTASGPALWATWNPGFTWQNVVVGDFNGDGKADIAGMENNVWWTGLSMNNNSFATGLWDMWPAANWKDVQTIKST
jgi:subtilisin-like proprotein convertase family protein